MSPSDVVNLTPVMERTRGKGEILIGLIDGPVATHLPDFASENILEIPGKLGSTCARADSEACRHGTLVAGILSARRGSPAPAICPESTLLVRPIFSEPASRNGHMPSAALAQFSVAEERELKESLDLAARRGVLVVAASGNQGTVGSTTITRHPWVIPVVACDLHGKPLNESNLGSSIGRKGLTAPGENITSLGADGEPNTFGGTSAAAPFVTGAIALLWSEFPSAACIEVKFALTSSSGSQRTTVVPPLLNAWAAYQAMAELRA